MAQHGTLQDWSGYYTSDFTTPIQPAANEAEVKAILERVIAEEGTVKILGSKHSCSTIWQTADQYVSLAEFAQLEIDAANMRATAQSGIVFQDLLTQLADAGYRIIATGGVTYQTMGGIAGTNTAPASAKYNIANGVYGIRVLLIEDGAVVAKDFNREDSPEEFFKYYMTLGLSCFLCSITYDIYPNQKYTVEEGLVTIDDLIENRDKWNSEYEFWRVNSIFCINKALFWGAKIAEDQNLDDKLYPEDDPSEKLAVNLAKAYYNLLQHFPGGKVTEIVEKVAMLVWEKFAGGFVDYYGDFKDMIPRDMNATEPVMMGEWAFHAEDFMTVLTLFRERLAGQEELDMLDFIPLEIEPIIGDKVRFSPYYYEGDTAPLFYKFNFMAPKGTKAHPDAMGDDFIAKLNILWDELVEMVQQGKIKPFRFHWGKIQFSTTEYITTYLFPEFAEFLQDVHPIYRNNYYAQWQQ